MAPKSRKSSWRELEAARQVRQKRLTELKSHGGVSDNLLAKIVNQVKKSGLLDDPKPVTRHALKKVGRDLFNEVRTTETLRLADGSDFVMEFCDPNLLLSKLVAESPELQRMYAQALSQKPCRQDSPWSLVVTFDEYSPGNAMSFNNKRKSMNINFSFLELGQNGLSMDDAWRNIFVVALLVCCVRRPQNAKAVAALQLIRITLPFVGLRDVLLQKHVPPCIAKRTQQKRRRAGALR
jgi:hypothetical protein